MGWWSAFRKQRAIRSYLREAPAALLERYGFVEGYSPARVQATLRALGLSREHQSYAIALFSPEREFTAWVRSAGIAPDDARAHELYRELRTEVAEDYNGGHDFVLKPPSKDFDQVSPLASSPYARGSGFRWYR